MILKDADTGASSSSLLSVGDSKAATMTTEAPNRRDDSLDASNHEKRRTTTQPGRKRPGLSKAATGRSFYIRSSSKRALFRDEFGAGSSLCATNTASSRSKVLKTSSNSNLNPAKSSSQEAAAAAAAPPPPADSPPRLSPQRRSVLSKGRSFRVRSSTSRRKGSELANNARSMAASDNITKPEPTGSLRDKLKRGFSTPVLYGQRRLSLSALYRETSPKPAAASKEPPQPAPKLKSRQRGRSAESTHQRVPSTTSLSPEPRKPNAFPQRRASLSTYKPDPNISYTGSHEVMKDFVTEYHKMLDDFSDCSDRAQRRSSISAAMVHATRESIAEYDRILDDFNDSARAQRTAQKLSKPEDDNLDTAAVDEDDKQG